MGLLDLIQLRKHEVLSVSTGGNVPREIYSGCKGQPGRHPLPAAPCAITSQASLSAWHWILRAQRG